ncbi:hypothetical protein [Listeria costaricensis]|uniref:hypothetical protein n=1 Tax=Listeria costaricensis TaxID=2026604 RepID=UPI000C06A0DB|nr:hypothetical protein [Listeria costaricensis]
MLDVDLLETYKEAQVLAGERIAALCRKDGLEIKSLEKNEHIEANKQSERIVVLVSGSCKKEFVDENGKMRTLLFYKGPIYIENDPRLYLQEDIFMTTMEPVTF